MALLGPHHREHPQFLDSPRPLASVARRSERGCGIRVPVVHSFYLDRERVKLPPNARTEPRYLSLTITGNSSDGRPTAHILYELLYQEEGEESERKYHLKLVIDTCEGEKITSQLVMCSIDETRNQSKD